MFYGNKTQQLAADILKKHVQTGRVSQAYFFTGEEFTFNPETELSRKDEFIHDFAAQLLGEDAPLDSRKRRILEDKHPDVMRLGADPDLTSIKVEPMRKLLEWTALKPFEGERRVAIIMHAEKLTDEAANAFLKTLEEAPGNMVFCLSAASRELVLDTIKSRCFEVRFPETRAWNPAASAALPPFKDMLDNYADMQKADLKNTLESALESIRLKVSKAVDNVQLTQGYLKAVQAILEAKNALDMNANSKLSVTRLVMRLRHAFPGERGLP